MRISNKDRVIVITGASSGIGAATALACAAEGMHVVLAARRQTRLASLARQIQDQGRRALVVPCDVDQDEAVAHLCNLTVNEFGRLDVFFANAGFGLFGSVLDTPLQQVRAIFETNFFGTVRGIKAAVPLMLDRNPGPIRGHVLICCSAASEIGLPMFSYYSATKAAQDSIAGGLRAELADQGIRVSSIHPIGTRTEFFDRAAERSGTPSGHNTPRIFAHSPRRVARHIVRCLRRPRPEVWPSTATRLALALGTASPRLGALFMRSIYRRHEKSIRG